MDTKQLRTEIKQAEETIKEFIEKLESEFYKKTGEHIDDVSIHAIREETIQGDVRTFFDCVVDVNLRGR